MSDLSFSATLLANFGSGLSPSPAVRFAWASLNTSPGAVHLMIAVEGGECLFLPIVRLASGIDWLGKT